MSRRRDADDISAWHRPSCADGHPHFCPSYITRRRRIDYVFKAMYPAKPPAPPSTFGLTDRELRAHANDLHAQGWPVAEICVVLDLGQVA